MAGLRTLDQLEDQNIVGEVTLWCNMEQRFKESTGQMKLEDCGGGPLAALEGHSLE